MFAGSYVSLSLLFDGSVCSRRHIDLEVALPFRMISARLLTLYELVKVCRSLWMIM